MLSQRLPSTQLWDELASERLSYCGVVGHSNGKRVRRIAAAAIVAWAVAAAAEAQEALPAINYSTNPTGAPGQCFEIIQSSLLARATFRVDKCAGFVDVLVKGSDGGNSWVTMPREKVPDGDVPASAAKDGINYQLFISGVAARLTFLMNMRTGATWQLVEDKKGSLSWQRLN
jgi:hypothetical protein